ncbi:unnamed protein product [Closterium sp. NIES-64]|nr:unnamed protein product [Closterium sp. NIES-64]CAI5957274.1 unnamed protein product [Closterium sp. NIES-64]
MSAATRVSVTGVLAAPRVPRKPSRRVAAASRQRREHRRRRTARAVGDGGSNGDQHCLPHRRLQRWWENCLLPPCSSPVNVPPDPHQFHPLISPHSLPPHASCHPLTRYGELLKPLLLLPCGLCSGSGSGGGGDASRLLAGVKHIVAVASAKGGVGKSTTAAARFSLLPFTAHCQCAPRRFFFARRIPPPFSSPSPSLHVPPWRSHTLYLPLPPPMHRNSLFPRARIPLYLPPFSTFPHPPYPSLPNTSFSFSPLSHPIPMPHPFPHSPILEPLLSPLPPSISPSRQSPAFSCSEPRGAARPSCPGWTVPPAPFLASDFHLRVRGCVPAYRMVQAGAETSQNIPALPIYDPHLLGVLQVFAPTVCQQVAWCSSLRHVEASPFVPLPYPLRTSPPPARCVRTACAAPCDRMPACADRMGLRKLARVAAATAPEEAVESDGQRTPSLSDVPPLKATL